MRITSGLLQGWLDVGALVILSLLCFIWAGQIPIAIGTGLLFVNLYFYIFIQQRFRADEQ
jgi:nicotinamide riboside transporter PnuC